MVEMLGIVQSDGIVSVDLKCFGLSNFVSFVHLLSVIVSFVCNIGNQRQGVDTFTGEWRGERERCRVLQALIHLQCHDFRRIMIMSGNKMH